MIRVGLIVLGVVGAGLLLPVIVFGFLKYTAWLAGILGPL